MLLAFHKPFGVLSQFTAEVSGQRTLAAFAFPKGVYPIGRLDQDSEGLLLLTDEAALVDRLLNPRQGHPRTYFVQVEGEISDPALERLAAGVIVQGRITLPCRARHLPAPDFPPSRSTHPAARQHPNVLAATGTARRPQPPGAAHDRSGRFSHAPPHQGGHRWILPGRAASGKMDCPCRSRTRPGPCHPPDVRPDPVM